MKFAPKLTALFISIGAIIAAVMFTIVYFQVAKILESEIRARMENRVFFTMDAMGRFLYERLGDIKIIANDPVISSGNATAEQITERLIFFRNAYKCYASFSFFNLERIRIADTAGLSIGEQNRMTRYWEDILSGKVSTASDVHIAGDLQVPVVYFASAVNNKEGRAIGVVVARIPTNRLFEMVKVSAKIQEEEEEEEEEEEIDIINKDGILIYSNHNREGILKENLPEWESIKIAQREKIFGSVKYRNPDEKEAEIHAFCREQGHLDFKGNGWTIIFNVPTRVIFGSIKKLLVILIVMFLVMLPGLALASYLFSKTVTLPLTRLSFAAAEIGKGKFDTVIEVRSKDEFGSLANTLSQMVADLKKSTTSIDGLNKEITERKKAEGALRESEARYKVLFFSAAEGIVAADLQTKRFSYVNPAICRMFGYTEEELTRIGVADIHPKESLDYVLAEFGAQVRGEKTLASGLPCLRKDGTLFYADVSATSAVLGGRKCLVGFFTDITERKRAEGKIKLFSDAIAGALDCFLLTDVKGNITYANESAIRAFGYTLEEFLRLNIDKLDVDPEVGKKVMQDLAMKGKWSGEVMNIRKNKEKFPAILSAFIIKDEEGNSKGTMGVLRDITESKQAEEELRVAYKELKQAQQELIQSSKMTAMGQLAAGISHELNQPLTGIKGFAQAVLMDLEKESPLRGDLNKIVGQADRMDTIIKNVRFFARKSDFDIVELDINKVVSDSLMLLSQQLRVHNIRVIQELGLGIPNMQGDPNQLQQAFLNIISNARDAILSLNRPEGGEIRIRTLLSQDRNHIEITFQDTGCGIPEGNLQHIFSLFYTTKSPDRGMGLGLSITYRIIKNHQGKIEFKSKEGQGTTFNIVLPLQVTKHQIKQS